jgi:hypothetical protein
VSLASKLPTLSRLWVFGHPLLRVILHILSDMLKMFRPSTYSALGTQPHPQKLFVTPHVFQWGFFPAVYYN